LSTLTDSLSQKASSSLWTSNVATEDSAATLVSAPVQEIFSSTQGEGIYVGKRQVFVRFAHCHLKCAYCDTPMTTPSGQCQLEASPGSGAIELHSNPMPAETLATLIKTLWKQARHHSVSLTGGEPLLYHRFLKEVLPLLKPDISIYLETSATQADFFSEITPWVDIVAMDIKLPSATKEAPRYNEHAEFYQLAKQFDCFIKLVFNEQTSLEELEAVKSIVSDRKTPIILQPETSLTDKKVYISPSKLFWIENHLSDWFNDVRIIPQTHKMLNVL